MSKIRKVLIVGGGIGGLTTAVALHRQGIEAEVAEINPDWSVYGVGIIQPSNALRALAQVGLGEKCLQAGCGIGAWRMCDSNGNLLVEVPSDNVAGPGYPANNGITRPRLHKILTESVLAQKTRVRLGVTVDHWAEEGGQLIARFTDGSSEPYDLMVVSDGAHSSTRAKVLQKELRAQFTGESVWRYNFPRPKDMRNGSIFYGRQSKAGLVPLSESLMYLFLVTVEPGNPKMPKERLHLLLRDRLAEYGGIVGGLRDAITDPAAVVYRPMETILLAPPWNRGRAILIGDAAHASTPHLAQGAAMAVEDAVLIAQLLGERPSWETAFEEFTARRFPRCELVMKAGLQMGEWEMSEWSGTPAADIDHGGLMHRTGAQLMQPI
jgi:2-polyprenyl-6-methoxyphenol hydroxylase-like FAD-dependent oxidoreductase